MQKRQRRQHQQQQVSWASLTQEGYAAGDRALPAGVAGGAPNTAHAHFAAVLEDAAPFRVLDLVRGLGPSEVAQRILNLLFAGLGLFAKLGGVCVCLQHSLRLGV